MPSSYPTTDSTPTDADDFGLGYGAKGKGVSHSEMEAKPGITVDPTSMLPSGGDVEKIQGKDWQSVSSSSDLPTGERNLQTTPYGFGNPMSHLDTIVDNSAPHKPIDEGSLETPSTNIRKLAALVRGTTYA